MTEHAPTEQTKRRNGPRIAALALLAALALVARPPGAAAHLHIEFMYPGTHDHPEDEEDTSPWVGDMTSMGDGSSTSGDTKGALEDDELYACYLDANDSVPQMMTHYECLVAHLKQWWVPSFMDMTVQLTATAMEQMLVLGKFMDAKTQLETQLIMDRLKAEAHKDYQPDTLMCSIGTNVRSLSASENQADSNAKIIATALLQRNVMAANAVTAGGPRNDYRSRLIQFKQKYCDAADDNGYLKNNPVVGLTDALCGEGNQPKNRLNRDIDYTRTIENSYTLDVDFTDAGRALTPDEEDVMALSHNLLGHQSFKDVPPKHLKHEYAKDGYQDMRSMFALRSVADNSMSHIIGMRAKGSPAVGQFMNNFIKGLGVSDDEIEHFLGENPSYFAQMEVLTSMLYEDPNFYSNLYTTPVNVERLGLTLEGIKLMQDRDRYEAALRREMLVSTILEMKLRELQSGIGDTTLQGLTVIFPGGP